MYENQTANKKTSREYLKNLMKSNPKNIQTF